MPNVPPCFQDATNAAKIYATQNFGTTAADWSSCVDAASYYYPSGATPCISFTDNTLATTLPSTAD